MKASTRKQLNVRSDEAYETAHRLAKRLGKSTQDVVIEALRDKAARELPTETLLPAQVVKRRLALLSEAVDAMWDGKHPPAIDPHDESWMYDERGLPR